MCTEGHVWRIQELTVYFWMHFQHMGFTQVGLYLILVRVLNVGRDFVQNVDAVQIL